MPCIVNEIAFPILANHSLSARANRVGLSVLKIWAQSKSSAPVADYIGVVVGDILAPELAGLVVGDVVCFTSPLLTAAGNAGHWSLGAAGSHDALKLYSSGLAVAVKPGTDSLHYAVAANQYTLKDVQVVSHKGIALSPLAGDVAPLSVGGDVDSLAVSVVFKDVKGAAASNLKSTLTPECQAELSHVAFIGPKYSFPALFTCHVAFSSGTTSHGVRAADLFDAAPTFDAASGAHRCVVRPKSITDGALLEAASKIDADFVVLTASSRAAKDDAGAGAASNPVSIPFVAPFYVLSSEAAADTTGAETGISLLISASSTASQALEISSSQPDLVGILKETGVDGLTKVTVGLLPDVEVIDDVNADIVIASTLTGNGMM